MKEKYTIPNPSLSPPWTYRLTAMLGSLIVLIATTIGCSLIVDLEEDCAEKNACAPYRCGDDNIACKSSCVQDRDCSLGATCSLDGGACEFSVCEPRVARQLITAIDASIDELAMRVSPDGNGVILLAEADDQLFEVLVKLSGSEVVGQRVEPLSDERSADFAFAIETVDRDSAVAVYSPARTSVSEVSVRTIQFESGSVESGSLSFGEDEVVTELSVASDGNDSFVVANVAGVRPTVLAETFDTNAPSGEFLIQHVDGLAARFGRAHMVEGQAIATFLESDSVDWRKRVVSPLEDGERTVDIEVDSGEVPTPDSFSTFRTFGSLYEYSAGSADRYELTPVYGNEPSDEVEVDAGVEQLVELALSSEAGAFGQLRTGQFENGVGLYFRYADEAGDVVVDNTRVVESRLQVDIDRFVLDASGNTTATIWTEKVENEDRTRIYLSTFACAVNFGGD